MTWLVLLLVYLGGVASGVGMAWGAYLTREALQDSHGWQWASHRRRAVVMAAGAVIWPVLLLIVLAGGIAMMMQTLREEQP